MLREVPPTAGMPLHWGDILPGGNATTLEQALSAFLGVQSCQIESSGTAGLVVALTALKLNSTRKTVLVPAYTCPLVALAIARAGLNIKPVDTAPDSFDFDAMSLKAACDQDTLCIMPTHLGGLAGDMEMIMAAAQSCGAYVIEDAAQALGASWRGQKLGTIGDIGVFSLTRGKGLTIYEGGAVVAKDKKVRQSLQVAVDQLAQSNALSEISQAIALLGYKLFYNPTALSLIYGAPLRYWIARGNYVQAVGDKFEDDFRISRVGHFRKKIGAHASQRLGTTLVENRERALRRVDVLKSAKRTAVITEGPDVSGSWPFIMVLMDCQEARDQALANLWSKGLGVTRLFIHDLPSYDYLKSVVPQQPMPNARSFASRMFTITNSHWLSDSDFQNIIDSLLA